MTLPSLPIQNGRWLLWSNHGSPQGLLGIHMHLLVTSPGSAMPTAETAQERAALDAPITFRATGFGYFLGQATRPQTIGYARLDSPVALAAWMLDHDTDAYYKISHAFVDGQPSGGLTRDTDVSLNLARHDRIPWFLTGSFTWAARRG